MSEGLSSFWTMWVLISLRLRPDHFIIRPYLTIQNWTNKSSQERSNNIPKTILWGQGRGTRQQRCCDKECWELWTLLCSPLYTECQLYEVGLVWRQCCWNFYCQIALFNKLANTTTSDLKWGKISEVFECPSSLSPGQSWAQQTVPNPPPTRINLHHRRCT